VLLSLTYPGLVLSAGFLNDTITLIFTPLTLSLTLSLGLNPIAYLLSVAGATNIGSVVIHRSLVKELEIGRNLP